MKSKILYLSTFLIFLIPSLRCADKEKKSASETITIFISAFQALDQTGDFVSYDSEKFEFKLSPNSTIEDVKQQFYQKKNAKKKLEIFRIWEGDNDILDHKIKLNALDIKKSDQLGNYISLSLEYLPH